MGLYTNGRAKVDFREFDRLNEEKWEVLDYSFDEKNPDVIKIFVSKEDAVEYAKDLIRDVGYSKDEVKVRRSLREGRVSRRRRRSLREGKNWVSIDSDNKSEWPKNTMQVYRKFVDYIKNDEELSDCVDQIEDGPGYIDMKRVGKIWNVFVFHHPTQSEVPISYDEVTGKIWHEEYDDEEDGIRESRRLRRRRRR